MRVFTRDMKRGLKILPFAALLVFLLMTVDNTVDYIWLIRGQDVGSYFYYLFYCLSWGGLFTMYVSRMCCVLSGGFAFCDDCSGGALRYAAERCGVKSYSRQRFFSSVLLGGLTLVCGYLLLMLFCVAFGRPIIQEYEIEMIGEGAKTAEDMPWTYSASLVFGNGLEYFFGSLFMGFCSGAVCSAGAMALSAYLPSRAAVFTAPFVISVGRIYLGKFILPSDSARPAMWEYLDSKAFNSDLYTTLLEAAFVVLVCAVCYLIFAKGVKRRLNNGYTA